MYVDIYTKILTTENLGRLGLNGKAYVDLFAGSGLNFIDKNYCYPLAGSMPIAANFCCKTSKFDHYYGVEKEKEFADALRTRMNKFVGSENCTIYNANVDDVIRSIVEDLNKNKYHFLAFIDYEGIKGFSWDNMEYLLRETKKGDILITMIDSTRTIGRANKGCAWSEADKKSLKKMYSEKVVSKSENMDDIFSNYAELVKEYRPMSTVFDIRNGFGYVYKILFVAAESKYKSKFVEDFETYKKRVKNLTGKDVNQVMKKVAHGQKSLSDF